ncbi:MAG TPA: type II toxin-antitoxin system ParD family antitoxin [Gammaproteobacteria bacterium]|nr:type II toxin-antitoxin system ParD family antitoxin [Gammaproteobacteria bacterium]
MAAARVRLPRHLEKFLDAQVRQGVYRSREAAIVAAVANEKRRTDQRDRLQAALQRGLESRSAGELDIEAVISRGRRRNARRIVRSRA